MRLDEMKDEDARKLLQKPWCDRKELNDAVSAMDKQQLVALELVDKDLREYMFSPQNSFFGQSINPNNLYGVILDSAKKHNLDSSYLHLTTKRLGVELGY